MIEVQITLVAGPRNQSSGRSPQPIWYVVRSHKQPLIAQAFCGGEGGSLLPY